MNNWMRRRNVLAAAGIGTTASAWSRIAEAQMGVKRSLVPIISVLANGATGNGVTDDAPVINALINAAFQGSQGTDAISAPVIHFPPGRYLLRSPLVVGEKLAVTLQGDSWGSTFLVAGPELVGKPMVFVRNSQLTSLSDFYFAGNVSAPPYAAVQSDVQNPSLGVSTRLRLERLLINIESPGAFQNGVAWTDSSGKDVNNELGYLSNVFMGEATKSGIYIGHGNSQDHVLINCLLNGRQAAISTNGGSVLAYGCEFGTEPTGFMIDCGRGSIYHPFHFHGCWSEGSMGLLRGSRDCTSNSPNAGVTFHGCDFYGAPLNQNLIDWSADNTFLVFNGCTIGGGNIRVKPGIMNPPAPYNTQTVLSACQINNTSFEWTSYLTIENSYLLYGDSFPMFNPTTGARLIYRGCQGPNVDEQTQGWTTF